MTTFRFHAISIDQVRDMFGADDALAARLREVAAAAFPGNRNRPRHMLGTLGPLFTRDRSREVAPDAPLRSDIDALLAGRHVEPDRLVPSWQVFLAWLEALGARAVTVTVDDVDGVEFDLARLGLSSNFSVRRLAERDLGIPLRAIGRQVAGYSRGLHASETLRALDAVLAAREEHVDPPRTSTTAVLGPLREVLGTVAASEGALDLVVISLDELNQGR